MSRTLSRALAFAALFLAPAAVSAQEAVFGMSAASSSIEGAGTGLVRFSTAAPGAATSIGAFTGVAAGQSVRSIDFRPSTGQLYAVSTNGTNLAQLYTVNTATAALTAVGTGFSLGTNTSVTAELAFNPVTDQIRVVTGDSNTNNSNFRVDPNTGALLGTDPNITSASGAAISIIGTAYTNPTPGATATTLYGWNFQSDALVTINGATGVATTVSVPPGLLTSNGGLGMSISGRTGTLFVTHDSPTNAAIMGLYTRDLASGTETLVGTYATGTFITDIALVPVPEPATLLAASAGALAAGSWLRRRVRAESIGA